MRGRGWIKALRQDDPRQVRAHCGTGARSHGDQMRSGSRNYSWTIFASHILPANRNRQIANLVASIFVG